MRISDWSSDVCSSDLGLPPIRGSRAMARARQRATPEGRTRRRRAGFARYHWCRRPRRSVSRVPSAHIQYEHVYPPGTDAADLLVQMQLPFVVLRQVPRDLETEA